MNNQTMCSTCNVKPATVYYTDVVNGVPHSRKFCLDCAQQFGLFGSLPFDDVFKSFDNVMKSFDDAFTSLNPTTPVDITCNDCGMTLSHFKKHGRFGCAKDYDLFKVGPSLEKIHGASVHTGKVPKGQEQKNDIVEKAATAVAEDLLIKLKKDMDAAVKSEDYEKAAQLRDEIKGLDKRIKESQT